MLAKNDRKECNKAHSHEDVREAQEPDRHGHFCELDVRSRRVPCDKGYMYSPFASIHGMLCDYKRRQEGLWRRMVLC